MITVLNKKTNELIGFDDATSSAEVNQAMRGYNYGEISTHKPTFYERTFQPVLKSLGANIATPNFNYTRPEPDPIGIFTRSAVKEATFGIIGNKQQQKWDQQDSDKFVLAEIGTLKITPSTLGPVAGMVGSIGIASRIASILRFPAVGAWANRLVSQGIVSSAETLGGAKALSKGAEVAGRVVGGAVDQAGTGAVFGGIRESVAQMDEEDPKWGKIGEAVLKDAGAFALYGAVGAGIPSKAVGAASVAGVAYGLAKAEGAPEEDAIFSGAIMAAFHSLHAQGDNTEFRRKVVNSTDDLIWGYLKSKSPIMDRSVAGKTANEFKMIVAQEVLEEKEQSETPSGWTEPQMSRKSNEIDAKTSAEIDAVVKASEKKREPANPIDEVISSQENTEAFVNKLAEKILDVKADDPADSVTTPKELTLEEAYKKKHEEVSKSIYKLKGTADDYYTKKSLHGKGMERSAVLRKLRGEPTDIEIKNELKVLNGNRIGKKVSTPDGDGVITSKPSFGKFRVNVNGTEKSYAFEDISSVMSTKEQAIESLRVKAEQEARQFLENHGEPFVEKSIPTNAKPSDVSVNGNLPSSELSTGQMNAPEGVTDTAVNIAYAEKMLAENPNATAEDYVASKVIPGDNVKQNTYDGIKYIEPPHEVRDTKKFYDLVDDMKRKGWLGRPILAVEKGGAIYALTGSHRIAAAQEVGIDPEVYSISYNKLSKRLDAEGIEKFKDFLQLDEYEQTKILKDVDSGAYDLIRREAKESGAVRSIDDFRDRSELISDFESAKKKQASSEGSKSQESQTPQDKQSGTKAQEGLTTQVLESQAGVKEIQQEVAGEVSVSSKENISQETANNKEDVKQSRVFQRARAKYEGLQSSADVTYDVKTLEDQIARAMDMSEKDPVRFKKIALGQMNAPEGVTDTAVNIVYAEKMLAEGNNAEAFRAIRNHSLKQTERGQEIAMENARATNVNDAQAFIQKVIEAKMMNAGKKLYEFSTKEKTGSAKRATTEKIKQEVKRVKEVIDKKQLDIDEAQKLIDELGCK
jgi:hypothetical protein